MTARTGHAAPTTPKLVRPPRRNGRASPSSRRTESDRAGRSALETRLQAVHISHALQAPCCRGRRRIVSSTCVHPHGFHARWRVRRKPHMETMRAATPASAPTASHHSGESPRTASSITPPPQNGSRKGSASPRAARTPSRSQFASREHRRRRRIALLPALSGLAPSDKDAPAPDMELKRQLSK